MSTKSSHNPAFEGAGSASLTASVLVPIDCASPRRILGKHYYVSYLRQLPVSSHQLETSRRIELKTVYYASRCSHPAFASTISERRVARNCRSKGRVRAEIGRAHV